MDKQVELKRLEAEWLEADEASWREANPEATAEAWEAYNDERQDRLKAYLAECEERLATK